MGAHRCWVIQPEDSQKAVLAATLRLLDAGRKVLVVHSGAVEGAQLELALLQALGGPSASLLLLHRSGSHEEFASALAALERVEGGLEVLLLPGDSVTDALDSRLVTLLTSDAHDWTLTCLYESARALGPALGEVLAHEHLRLTASSSADDGRPGAEHGPRLDLSSDEARLLAVDLLLRCTDSAAEVQRVAADARLQELSLDPALLTAVAGEHLRRIAALTSLAVLKDEGDATARTVVDLDEHLAAATRHRTALQLCDGELVPLLRAAAGLAGYPLSLEDADFRVFHWSDEPSPPPRAFATLMTPTRVARFAKTLRPGVPEAVRLGLPADGFRLVMRLGHRRPVGYLSVLDAPQTCPPQLHLLLQQLESPLVTAMRYEQGLLRLSYESRAQVLHDMLTGRFTASEQEQAAAFTRWLPQERRRVAYVLPRQRSGTRAAGADAVDLNMLRVSAESAGLLASVVGSGLAILSTDSDAAKSSLSAWLAVAGSFTLGYSDSIPAASDVPLALRQAQWTARVAHETAREVLGFDQLGFDRLLFPSADAPDLDMGGPLHQLRAEATTLGFDPRETLAAFLDAGGSIRDAARALHVHANTLRYRLARMEKVCDLKLDDPRCRFDLQLALRQEASWRVLRGL